VVIRPPSGSITRTIRPTVASASAFNWRRDRQSMSFAFDLWSYDDVRTRAADILSRLQAGSMPCDGAWSAAKVEIFQRWIDTGAQS